MSNLIWYHGMSAGPAGADHKHQRSFWQCFWDCVKESGFITNGWIKGRYGFGLEKMDSVWVAPRFVVGKVPSVHFCASYTKACTCKMELNDNLAQLWNPASSLSLVFLAGCLIHSTLVWILRSSNSSHLFIAQLKPQVGSRSAMGMWCTQTHLKSLLSVFLSVSCLSFECASFVHTTHSLYWFMLILKFYFLLGH